MRQSAGRRFVVSVVFAALSACSWGGSSSNTPGPDASIAHPVCGDGVCAASEVNSCVADCGSGGGGGSGSSGSGSGSGTTCGDFVCEAGETAATCPSDCGSGGGGSGSGGGSGALNCSDQNVILACVLCQAGLGCTGVDATSCAACLGGIGSGGGSDIACTGGAPDGVCDSMESNLTCPSDCP